MGKIMIGALAGTLFAAAAAAADQHDHEPADAHAAELFKTPDCTCCDGYAEHLRAAGFEVMVKPTLDLAAMTAAAGVPPGLEGCHLVFIDGYVVSGHVPVAVVERLLSERPEIQGVTLPGMPMGSPGMPGEKSELFTVIAFGGGVPSVFAVE